MPKILVVEAKEESFRNFRERFLDELVHRGHIVAASAPNLSPLGREDLRRRGIQPETYQMRRSSVNPIRELRTLLSLRRLIRRQRPDLVVAYTPKLVIYSSLAARLGGRVKSMGVLTGLGYGLNAAGLKGKLLAGVQLFLYRLALPHLDALFFQNTDDYRRFHELGLLSNLGRAGTVRGSGVDMEKFQPAPAPIDHAAFLYIGRLIAGKGIREYLAAAREVGQRFPDARFYIAGRFDPDRKDGLTKAELNEALEKGEVTYLGSVDDIRVAIARANVIVLPSHGGEGTPRSVLEGLAMERATITTNSPGCRETVIENVTGLIVPVRDACALSAAMARYASDPELAREHGKAGYTHAAQHYDVKLVNRELIECIESLTSVG